MSDVYLIAYELRNPDSIKNQDSIANSIKAVSGDWWHHLGSVWLVAVDNLTAYEIYKRISPSFKLTGAIPEDSFLIARLSKAEPATVANVFSGFLPKAAWDWIQSKSAGVTPMAPPKAQAER